MAAGLVGLVNVVCSFFARIAPGKVCAAITVCP